MSTIQTPPQERQPVETRVCEYSDDLVRHAIRQELNRDGQVFYLHNRVQSIRNVEKHLKELLPEARIGVAHGQMSEKTLSSVMQKFVDGKLDVLLCTTIIESGMDIPNVNTILIDRADRFGMADLYQLRGRVGRYHHQAYAYLLLPRHGRLFDTARKRIGAIQRYSALGAGFKLALRDLEIRGAGNLLGAQQSGHIAAIGFELYCQLLRRTVAQLNGEKIPPIVDVELRLDFIQLAPAQANAPNAVCLPYGYVEDESLRVNLYRRIATAATDEDVTQLRNELADRFGPLPDAADRLLLLTRLRTLAARHDIRRIETQDTKLIMIRHEDYIMPNRRFPRLTKLGCTERLEEIIQQIEQLS
jgi:transcription-repair coupling factor (superfamily II helicase)